MRDESLNAQNLRHTFKRAGAESEIFSHDPENATHDVRDARRLYGNTTNSHENSAIRKGHHGKNVRPNLQQQSPQSKVVNTTSEGSWPSLNYFGNGIKLTEHNSGDSALQAGFDNENGCIVVLRGDTEVLSIKPQDCHTVNWDEEDEQRYAMLSLRGQPSGVNGSILLEFRARQDCIDFMDSLRRISYIKFNVKPR